MNAPFGHNPDHRESAENYRGEVYRLGGWRVAVCKDGIQWLLQVHRRDGTRPTGRWRSRHYITTRAALIRLWRGETGDDGAALAALLPERIRR